MKVYKKLEKGIQKIRRSTEKVYKKLGDPHFYDEWYTDLFLFTLIKSIHIIILYSFFVFYR